MITKTLIIDTLTQKYYCVEMTAVNAAGEPTCGDNDFPYWSADIDEAYDFKSELFAQNEMAMNDLTCDGTRKPVIIAEKDTEYMVIEYTDRKGTRYMNHSGEFGLRAYAVYFSKGEAEAKMEAQIEHWTNFRLNKELPSEDHDQYRDSIRAEVAKWFNIEEVEEETEE